jgi:uncharacterized metal-binding protein
MVDPVFHTGHTHPDLWWILVPSLLSFILGLVLGNYTHHVSNWLRPSHRTSNE